MKIYVATKAKPFQEETYLFVELTLKGAEKELRRRDPFIKKTRVTGYTQCYSSGKGENTTLYFIHEEET